MGSTSSGSNGGDGGDVTLSAATNVSITSAITANGGTGNSTFGFSRSGGAAGNISITGPTGIRLTANLTANGGSGINGGSAGADGAYTINDGAATVTTGGGVNDGQTGGTIDGGTFTKSGNGIFNLGSANIYNGSTTISAGVLLLNNATAIPGGIGSSGGTANININGGVIGLGVGNFSRGLGTGATQVQFTGSGGFAAYNADRTVNLGGSGTPTGVTWASGSFVPSGQTLILGASSATNMVDFQNPINLNAATRTVQVDNGSASIDGKISGIISTSTGTAGLTKTGTGTLALSATNTYNGTTTVSAGVIDLQNASGLGNTTGTTTVTAGAAIQIDGSGLSIAEPINTLNSDGISAGGALRNLANNNTWSGAITLGSASRINSDAGALTITGGITGATQSLTIGGAGNITFTTAAIGTTTGSLTKDGAGTLSLNFANTYTGSTTITAGILQLGVANAIKTGSTSGARSGIILNGGTFSSGSGAGFSDGVLGTPMGTLALTDNSIITLGTGNHSLYFDVSSGASWTPGKTLTITGWLVTGGATGTAGKIFIGTTSGTLTAGQLSQITFTGYSCPAIQLPSGEIVPGSAPSIGTQPTDQTACSTPGTASFAVIATGAVSYQWRLNGSNLIDGLQLNGSTVSRCYFCGT